MEVKRLSLKNFRNYKDETIEFAPRDEVLDWANDVISSYPDYRAILTTHSKQKK